jgi:hypothetical protein
MPAPDFRDRAPVGRGPLRRDVVDRTSEPEKAGAGTADAHRDLRRELIEPSSDRDHHYRSPLLEVAAEPRILHVQWQPDEMEDCDGTAAQSRRR